MRPPKREAGPRQRLTRPAVPRWMHAMFGRDLREHACKPLGIAAPASSGDQPAAPTTSLRQPSVETVLAPLSALVRRIRVAYGHPDDQFEGHLLAPITALASW